MVRSELVVWRPIVQSPVIKWGTHEHADSCGSQEASHLRHPFPTEADLEFFEVARCVKFHVLVPISVSSLHRGSQPAHSILLPVYQHLSPQLWGSTYIELRTVTHNVTGFNLFDEL